MNRVLVVDHTEGTSHEVGWKSFNCANGASVSLTFCTSWQQVTDQNLLASTRYEYLVVHLADYFATAYFFKDFLSLLDGVARETRDEGTNQTWYERGTHFDAVLGFAGGPYALQDVLGSVRVPEPSIRRLHEKMNAGTFEYLAGVEEIKSRLCFDPVLEAKLEILHMCLTPEGCSRLMKQHAGSWGRFASLQIEVTRENGEKTFTGNLADAIKELAHPERDCFSPEYVGILSEIRDALLPISKPRPE
ncbi:MAG: hypothetical protein AABO57_23635 [Acidobacteriota bacterium]